MKPETFYRDEFYRVYGELKRESSVSNIIDEVWEDRDDMQDVNALAVKMVNLKL